MFNFMPISSRHTGINKSKSFRLIDRPSLYYNLTKFVKSLALNWTLNLCICNGCMLPTRVQSHSLSRYLLATSPCQIRCYERNVHRKPHQAPCQSHTDNKRSPAEVATITSTMRSGKYLAAGTVND
nr:g4.2 [Tranosema rostrale ichnovirus]